MSKPTESGKAQYQYMEAIMLELQKKQIHMSRSKNTVSAQVTFDEDFNIPDAKPDVGSVLLKQADAVMEELRQLSEKVIIKGRLDFEILYAVEGSGRMKNLSGALTFEENVSYPGLEPGDYVRCRTKVEDISIRVVNSRKLHISAVLGAELFAASAQLEEAARSLSGQEDIAVLGKDMEVVSLQLQKKDTFRMEDDVVVAPGKPLAQSLLWKSLSLRSMEYQAQEDKMLIQAEAALFVIYEAGQEQLPMQWMEKTISFTGELPLVGCRHEMIPSVEPVLIKKEISIHPDEDGENRIFHVEAVVELDMKLYLEEKVHLLCDAYSTTKEVDTSYKTAHLETLQMKNKAKCRITEKIPLHSTDTMLQICHSEGTVSIDRTEIVSEGIRVEGAVYVTVLYLAANDERPMQAAAGVIPLSHVIEAGGITPGSCFTISPMLEQITTMIAPGGQGEVRAVISLDTFVLSEHEISVLDQVSFTGEQIDPNDFPGMIGYIVQPGDNLWSIAKKYRMSIERIREVNQDNTKADLLNATASSMQKEGKSPEELGTKPGQKLLLVR
ncbi:DUF3794 and LysM peptidoglycan-binding domain-containing protein [Anthropogastromicrobium aceti]|nr:SPOCS domain-containing protein [Anthropogastromicrobium aceti]